MPTPRPKQKLVAKVVRTAKDAIASGELPFQPQKKAAAAAPSTTSNQLDLPVGEASARKVTRWLMGNFGAKLEAAGKGTPFTPAILCAIVCQETAYFWLPMLEKLEQTLEFKSNPGELVDLIIARCVLDASGDHPDSPRSAFPKNTAAFRAKYGNEFTNFLIEEANQSRKLRDYGPKDWVYKGYGLFQYDLQFVVTDEAFFRERKWYDFDACLAKCIGELKSKYKTVNGDLWEAIRDYNGSGPRAKAYREKVRQFAIWTANEISKLAPGVARAPVARAARAAVPAAGASIPNARPRLSQNELAARLAIHNIDRATYPLIVVGIRGYFMDSMGQPGVNDRGIYDDAILIDSPDGFASYNGNTDPSRHRPGQGSGTKKGIASLKLGAWYAHKLDFHGSATLGPYRAICQRLGKVTVIRDGTPPYEETGNFGINIHKGSYNGTSSLGCQTIHPDQWPSFINLAMDLAKRYYAEKWDKTAIPYILIEA